ncbi:penicillin-binding transpeptidase domain-containing protein [Actinomadura opuntiae]|uniref:penicillin-binding transpeptidase domain-containing protein n=1 Tax=Actinomadura sp. OS1-43 TaxID=604315 RepID=UPI00255AB6A2|nr:penicillin-binding transpeptidase domain-containing protein [Actinomadura sp. OS1-43]MDL4814588.1 penicillin-binding transpeptidase domain-containing protein [Actinomadura sp. OS1-43]
MSKSNRGRPARTPRRLPRGSRTVRRRAVSLAACGALVATMTTGCWAEPSAMPAVRDFLIAWQVGNYPAAAKKTTGADQKAVASALGAVRAQLDAASLRLSLGVSGGQGRVDDAKVKSIAKKGDDADARFSVKVDLGENGQPWEYLGHMHLRRVGGQWKVVWNPSIINPELGPGQRLAVVSEVPARATIKDGTGRSMLHEVLTYNFGVVPGHLADPQRTIDQLTKVAKFDGGRRLDSERLLGRVRSAPPQKFLPLLTLRYPQQRPLANRLLQIPGVQNHPIETPSAPNYAPELVGGLGPATADLLQQVGAPYQPGDTIGVSGIQLLQQRRLAGTPTVKVVAQDSSGKATQVLKTWDGLPPQEVSTTLDPSVQRKADNALKGLPYPASMVALRPATGQVVAVSNHGTGGENRAFEAHYPAGMTFGIVTAEALFARAGMNSGTKTECPASVTVGGKTFTNKAHAGASFASHFALGCKTTLAQLSGKLDARALQAEAAQLGIGRGWGASVPAFTGSLPPLNSEGAKAAAMVGDGVQVSPLAMALVAGAAENGTWRSPYVLKDPSKPADVPPQNLQSQAIADLKSVMTRTVSRGVAQAAHVTSEVAGTAAYAQYAEGGRDKTVSWFVGSHGDLAFAVAIEGPVSASKVAAKFLRSAPTAARTGTPTAG